jgi:Cof subfamily protein (haloacid dehalogenase superfamily)
VQQPRLVASDVDGTLLPAGWVPTDRTRAAVARVLASGTPFVLVTGRPPRWILELGRYLPGVRQAVSANGAVRYDIADDRVLSAATLSTGQLTNLAAAAKEVLPGSWLAVERISEYALDERSVPRIEQGHRPNWTEGFINEPRALLLSEPAIKLLIQHDELTSDQMLSTLGQRIGSDTGGDFGGATLTFSNPNGLLEAASAGVTKAAGLAGLVAELGIAPCEVIAFGDMPNDVEMLRWAGHGVAMGNAHPDVLAVADEVTASNIEDGVALVLERWF